MSVASLAIYAPVTRSPSVAGHCESGSEAAVTAIIDMESAWCIVLCALHIVQSVHGCGVLTHIEIGQLLVRYNLVMVQSLLNDGSH